MKKILVAAPFVILLVLIILSIMGALEYNLFAFACPVAPLIIGLYFYSKVVTRNHINILLLASWTVFAFSGFLTLVSWPHPIFDVVDPAGAPSRAFMFRASSAFTGIGIVALAFTILRKRSSAHGSKDAIPPEDPTSSTGKG